MLTFIIRRLILVIPTLIVVLILTFLLSKLTPGDEVYSRLMTEGQATQYRTEEFEKIYREEQKKLGLQLPLFYITLRPHYEPNESGNIIPVTYKRALFELNKEIKDWKIVHDYHQQLSFFIKQLELKTADRNLLFQLNQLQKANTISRAKSFVNILESYEDIYPAEIMSLIGMIKEFKNSQEFPRPKIEWHGSQNQFHFWVTHIFDSNSRKSLVDGRPVLPKIFQALKWTLTLSIIALLIGVGLSLILAMWQFGRTDMLSKIISTTLYVFYAVPLFWLATVMVVFFTTEDYGVWTNIFPSVGISYWNQTTSLWGMILQFSGQLILPVLCMVLVSMAYLSRQLLSDLGRELKLPYITTARSKGVDNARLKWKHILPNALMSFITIITGALPRTIVGSAIIETIFNIPGVGKLMLDSIYNNDWPVSFTIILLVGGVTVISYLLADLLYLIFFPKMADKILTNV